MPTPINRVPAGLQGILDNQTRGQNPSSLNDEVQPTFDISRLFLDNTLLRQAQATSDRTGQGIGGTQGPELGKVWYVLSIEARATQVAAGNATVTLVPVIQDLPGTPGGGQWANVAPGYSFQYVFNGATVEYTSSTGLLSYPIAVRAPGTIGVRVAGTTFATTLRCQTSVLYYETDI